MSTAIANASRLKPEIRLAQAVSQFEADLSSNQKIEFRAHKSRTQNNPPDARDVMRLTAEIDRHAAGKTGGGRCFGPRMTNFLYAVQQFAAIGDVMVGGTQNLIACGVWSIVRMSLLVSISIPLNCLCADTFVVNRKLLFLLRKVVWSPYECWSLGSPLPKYRFALSAI